MELIPRYSSQSQFLDEKTWAFQSATDPCDALRCRRKTTRVSREARFPRVADLLTLCRATKCKTKKREGRPSGLGGFFGWRPPPPASRVQCRWMRACRRASVLPTARLFSRTEKLAPRTYRYSIPRVVVRSRHSLRWWKFIWYYVIFVLQNTLFRSMATEKLVLSEEEWRARLTPAQFKAPLAELFILREFF